MKKQSMNVSLYPTAWHGISAWALENERIRTVILPEMGAKIVSLFDKRSQREWLAGPGSRPLKPVTYGAPFVEQDMSGWDEMFPTIVACEYPRPGERHGRPLPDHGEVWALPWTVNLADEGRLTLQVEGRALPYRLTRTARYCAADSLQLDYELLNLGQERMPYIWAAHPQFICGQQAEIIFPPDIREVVNTISADWGWGAPEARLDWPEAVLESGARVKVNQTGGPELQRGRKVFALPEVRAGWAGLVRHPSGDWLHMDWDPEKVPYLGLWVDEGAINSVTVAAPEPTTGFYDSLALAYANKQVTSIEAGAVHSWSLVVQVGTGEDPFPGQD